MANKHNNLKRIVHRASEEIYASRMIAKETSWREGLNAFRAKLDIQVMKHNGYRESDAVKARLLRKHEAVLQYLENKFGDFYAAYDYQASLPEVDPALKNKIWMCWWQGLDTAPEIVKACIESVRRNAGGVKSLSSMMRMLKSMCSSLIGFGRTAGRCARRVRFVLCCSRTLLFSAGV